MSTWTVTIATGEDGTPYVDSFSGEIPPGEIEVGGDSDSNRITLQARQRDYRGRFMIGAYHQRDLAEEALHHAEDIADTVTAAGGTAAVGVSVTGDIPETPAP